MGKSQRWTDAEWSVVFDNLENGDPNNRVRDLSPLLPGRSPHNIHNALNRARRFKAHQCICGNPLPPHKSRSASCDDCRALARTRRKEALQQGLCGYCKKPLGKGSSLTMCPKCRAYHQEKNLLSARKKGSPPRGPKNRISILRWPSNIHNRWFGQVIANENRPAHDLFGGAARGTLYMQEAAGDLVRSYNDLDHRLVSLVRCARDGRRGELRDAITTPSNDPDVLRAMDILREVKPDITRKCRWFVNMGRIEKNLQKLRITNLDALDMVADPDRYFEKDAILILDPPWIGSDTVFKHTLNRDRWKTLINLLLDLPGPIDFILSLGAEREALKIVAETMPAGHLRLRHGKAGYQSAIAISPRLASRLRTPTRPVDLRDYGLRSPKE